MSDLTAIERRRLERALGMESGYVLEFSNRTFADFFYDTINVDIYGDTYSKDSGSKANRMRAFWDAAPNFLVAKILSALIEEWTEYAGLEASPPSEDVVRILRRLEQSAPIPDLDAIVPITEESSFERLAAAVRESIERNEPETGLDRLHTFVTKFFRTLCNRHGVDFTENSPLHSLVGGYVKAIEKKGLIESPITGRILKSAISVFDSFNGVRNNQSFAHDNVILNYEESLLIFGHVCGVVKFVQTIESSNKKETQEECSDKIPF